VPAPASRVSPAPPASPSRRLTDVRGHNLALLLREVHLRGEVTRAELTELSGLNRSTILQLVADLQDMGLVVDHPPNGGMKPGRPSHLVTARPDGPFTIAVDLDVDRVVVATVGLGGRVLARSTVQLPTAVDAAAAVDIIDRALEQLETDTAAGHPPCGVGVSIPGTVRGVDGLVRSAPNLGWVDVPLADLLGGRLRRRHPDLPVRVANDADLGARAEHLRGAARDVDDVVYLSGHVGVGGGIITGGLPLSGARGFAGELGHMVLDVDGPRCRCGGRGCLEALVGATALCTLAGPKYRRGTNGPARVFTDAATGHHPAEEAVRAVAARLGTGLANIVTIFDPDMIIVGGLLEQVLDHCRTEVDIAMRRQLTTAARTAVTVRTPGLGADSSLLGAAELGFDELFNTTLNLRDFTSPIR